MKKTILITGASSGIGKETAKLFQQNGWNVVATMRAPEKEQELTKLENVLVLPLNVQDTPSIKAAIAAGIERFGKIDALVNSAGYGLMGVFESATKEQIQKQYAVNVFGLMDVTQVILPHFRANGGGAIINLSSFGGVVSLPFGSPYNSTKFAVEGFSEALSHELIAFNIAVKIVEPGSIATNFRNGVDMIKNEIPAYNDMMAALFPRFAKATEHIEKSTAADVAQTIYEAATDGKPRLRYVIGADAQYFIDLKYKNTEEDFIQQVRAKFVS